MEEVTKVLPAIALRGTTILPDMIVHFDISRPKSVRAVEEAMLGNQKIFLITQKDPDTEVPGLLDVYKIGTIAVTTNAFVFFRTSILPYRSEKMTART